MTNRYPTEAAAALAIALMPIAAILRGRDFPNMAAVVEQAAEIIKQQGARIVALERLLEDQL